ncbi:HET-domain-containing protein [Dothidotthia symphoricarpi CBS 119687]|uniref:HET-domain-containing protein n=1 Tax=Dothidotthia symphoricarpi CBS 119687 TaxID=1392245 RepID=A0A6A6A6L5_9PLEO|nr:HET-domain-containing protein [Dothidotthia symphoricarpi CBS 119687]KAF2126261.1 HET-domain-containing protein [Dothidotthia symphoricarpi CBS 119687]
MAAQTPGKSRNPLWDNEETVVSAFMSGFAGVGRENRLELPQHQPRLPIIRPPEGCEKMKPTDFKDLHYRDLPTPTSIRLLKIYPGPEGCSTESYSDFELFRPPVRCSLVVVDLNDNVAYDALSYTWGDPCTLYLSTQEISPQEAWAARAFNIEVDGKAVSVGSNLYAALLGLRSHVTHQKDPQFSNVPQSSGCFWIDALCINQNNLEEKSSQVMMMSRIYQQARLVFAWLGGGDRLSAQAFHDLVTIVNLCQGNNRDPKELRSLDISSDETYQKLGIPKLNYTSWIGVYLFLNRAWFKRAWIVQEIALAREPWFMCGRQHGNVELVLRSFEILQRSRWFDQLRHLAEPLIQTNRTKGDFSSHTISARSSVKLYRPRKTHILNSSLGSIVRQVRISMGTFDGLSKDESAPKRLGLLRLLDWYRYTESGNARDKVYAFVGLSPEQETNPLMVNYRLTVEEVFVEATRYLLDSLQSLQIFSLKKNTFDAEPMLELPSWVPDFTVQNLSTPINQHASFAASKGLGSVEMLYLPRNKLQLKGIKLDEITSVGVTFKWALIPELSLLLQKVTPPEGQTRFETFWRTLLFDSFEGETPAPKECGSSFLGLLENRVLTRQLGAAFSLRYAEDLIEFRASNATLSDALPEEVREYLNIEQARELLGAMYTASQHMMERCTEADGTIFPPEFVDFEHRRSKSGSKAEDDLIVESFHDELREKMDLAKPAGDIDFLISATAGHGRSLFVTKTGRFGMGPPLFHGGDEVWILAGADVPLILRPSGSSGEEFELVGEAYIHGIMQGEGVPDVQKEGLRRVILV